ncbi:hypothetical protein ORI89_18675 [Sphingobacterium sp. UT-1RO-CII-1]|uniref:hypothetical protein n=1 Tax=Sphingobacterium sp. UT-1RO-CII-1 TaxID=2995225 RepID=UPI00227B804B|nr:hypothetical protein [Sphingobacterium sp. UT-1RO-CII-1]MCY4781682.1 hypothetical protein [Sphingobacterium sp. UT-1RO-CII-1]
MEFPLTKNEIRTEVLSAEIDEVCQFDVAHTLRVRQVVSEIHSYTTLLFETSTKAVAGKIAVRRIK